jgi:predicted transcriptional regulator of viral defense system
MTETPVAIRQDAVRETFETLGQRVFSPVELREIVKGNRDRWFTDDEKVDTWPVESRNIASIVTTLNTQGVLNRVQLPFPHRKYQRFTFSQAHPLEIVQSVDPNAYFCHYTALHLHGLTTQIPKTIYLNVEQAGTGGRAELSQEAIDRAFRGKCRLSSNMIELGGQRVFKLNGRNTGKLGVVEFTLEDTRSPLRITNIERTLIDATVRPVYAGGVGQVAEAYRAAADHDVSVNRIAAYLRKLAFNYPYHQAIGFYLERAGAYRASQIQLLRAFRMEYDFYLTYEMSDPDYNERWRLFVPKGFQ